MLPTLFGCYASKPYTDLAKYSVESTKDEFDGTATHRMTFNRLETIAGRGTVYFDLASTTAPLLPRDLIQEIHDSFASTDSLISRLHKETGDTASVESHDSSMREIEDANRVELHILYVEYFGPEWLFVREDNSMYILIDGVRHDYSATQMKRDVIDSSLVGETVSFLMTDEDLSAIVGGKEVKVRLRGDGGTIDAQFTPQAHENLRAFVAEYCQPKGD
jgi:hypothetical protein